MDDCRQKKAWKEHIVRLPEKLSIRHLYLGDKKRFTSQTYLAFQSDVLAHKYQGERFDVVICSDNNALSFLLAHRKELFPETKRIVVVIDETVTGKLLRAEILVISREFPTVQWLMPNDLSLLQWQDQLKSLEPGDLVLLGLFLRESSGAYFEYDEVAARISTSSTVPVYVLWDFYLQYGVVGGYLASGTFQGEKAVELVQQILAGRRADDIPVVMDSPNHYLADYNVMARFGLSEEQFPKETIIHNQPPDFYKEHKVTIWIFMILFMVLALLTLFLSINVVRKKKAEHALLALTEELEDRVILRTNELSSANQEITEREQ